MADFECKHQPGPKNAHVGHPVGTATAPEAGPAYYMCNRCNATVARASEGTELVWVTRYRANGDTE